MRKAQIWSQLYRRYNGITRCAHDGKRNGWALWRYGVAAKGEPRLVTVPVPESVALRFL